MPRGSRHDETDGLTRMRGSYCFAVMKVVAGVWMFVFAWWAHSQTDRQARSNHRKRSGFDLLDVTSMRQFNKAFRRR